MVLLLMFAAFTSPMSGVDHCQSVRGTYAIYANHDLLHIDGSRHFVEVTSDELDAALRRHGWENTVAHGNYTICGPEVGNPQELNIQSNVELRNWTDIRFERRKHTDP